MCKCSELSAWLENEISDLKSLRSCTRTDYICNRIDAKIEAYNIVLLGLKN
jgi:hypothetical protein